MAGHFTNVSWRLCASRLPFSYSILARKLLGEEMRDYRDFMNSSGHLAVSESARRLKKTRAQKRSRNRGRNGKGADAKTDPATTMAAAGTLTRTKALLLAALRVWELKHRIHE